MPRLERLTTRIIYPHDPTPSTEDIFSSALETLFTDNTHQSHGVPGRSIIYRSPRFGDVYLLIPSHPDEQGGRLLFAHYLWNAAVIAAEAIERASCGEDVNGKGGSGGVETRSSEDVSSDGNSDELVHWDKRYWGMRGMDILELGAATALPSLISTLSNARSVTSTDHPSSPAILSNTISSNFTINVTNRNKHSSTSVDSVTDTDSNQPSTTDPSSHSYTNDQIPTLHHPPVTTTTKITIQGYTWGTTTFYSPQTFGVPASHQPDPKSFDRIIVADCLWMPAQHENLVRSVLTYLRIREETGKGKDKNDYKVPCALVVAGFHTGRSVVGDFVRVATGDVMGGHERDEGRRQGTGEEEEGVSGERQVRGKLRAVEIFEVDIDGRRRSWRPERLSETKEQSKRWSMCAVLVRR